MKKLVIAVAILVMVCVGASSAEDDKKTDNDEMARTTYQQCVSTCNERPSPPDWSPEQKDRDLKQCLDNCDQDDRWKKFRNLFTNLIATTITQDAVRLEEYLQGNPVGMDYTTTGPHQMMRAIETIENAPLRPDHIIRQDWRYTGPRA